MLLSKSPLTLAVLSVFAMSPIVAARAQSTAENDAAAAPVRAADESAAVRNATGDEAPTAVTPDKPASQDAAELDAVVVVGFRTANEASITAKREATGIVDAISQDRVGLLPDLTIGQVASRIPGVSLVPAFGANNDRSYDSAESIAIRGISSDHNLITLDGLPLASAQKNRRGARVELIPPSGIKRIEVYKTIGADLDHHALSGQLNMVTASAFDTPGRQLSLNGFIGSNSTAGDVVDDQGENSRFDGVFSSTFGSEGQFGIVASASYSKYYATNYSSKPGVRDDTYLFYSPDPASNEYDIDFARDGAFPASYRNQIFAFQDERERMSGTVKLEWSPDWTTHASLFYGHFQQDEHEDRQEYLALSDRDSRPLDQTATGGLWGAGRVEYGYVLQPEKRTTDVLNGIFRRYVGERGRLQARASYSSASTDSIEFMSKFRPRDFYAGDAFSYDLGTRRPVLDFVDPSHVNDLSRYSNDYIRERGHESEQDVLHLDLSYAYNMDESARGFGFDAGGSMTRTEQAYDFSYDQGRVFVDMDAPGFDADDPAYWASMDNYAFGTTLPTTDPDAPFFLIDDARLRDDWYAQGRTITSDRTDSALQDDYRLEEDIGALFARVGYRAERYNVVAGLRYESAEVNVDGWARDNRLEEITQDSDVFVPYSRTTSYDYFLPSVIGRFDLTDKLVLRTGYGRTLGRPNYSDYARGESIGVPDEINRTISISRGNPDLKPRLADNFDLSLEYYFDDGASLLSAAVFKKDISDWIYIRSETFQDFEFEGELYEARIDQPVNASDASLDGVELSFRKDFHDTLPAPWNGFIFDANLSFIDGEIEVVDSDGNARTSGSLPDQPDMLANVALSYEDERFGAKIAYTWVDDFIANLSVEDELYDVYTDARSSLDLQVRYRLNDSFMFVGEVNNLTDEDTVSYRTFPSGNLLAEETQRGRTVWVGVKWSPEL